MSTVDEIESAIGQLLPEDFRALHEWMAKHVAGMAERTWSPEELVEDARQMGAESDPVRARALWEKVAAGFYGEAGA